MKMRRVVIFILLASASLLIACSYGTDFAVVNDSNHPIKVKYRVKQPSKDPFGLAGMPAKIVTSQLRTRSREWRELTTDEYHIDQGDHSVVVPLMPGEALRLTTIYRYEDYDDSQQAKDFFIEEISVSGANGELTLIGERVRKAFVSESRTLRTLIYK